MDTPGVGNWGGGKYGGSRGGRSGRVTGYTNIFCKKVVGEFEFDETGCGRQVPRRANDRRRDPGVDRGGRQRRERDHRLQRVLLHDEPEAKVIKELKFNADEI